MRKATVPQMTSLRSWGAEALLARVPLGGEDECAAIHGALLARQFCEPARLTYSSTVRPLGGGVERLWTTTSARLRRRWSATLARELDARAAALACVDLGHLAAARSSATSASAAASDLACARPRPRPGRRR